MKYTLESVYTPGAKLKLLTLIDMKISILSISIAILLYCPAVYPTLVMVTAHSLCLLVSSCPTCSCIVSSVHGVHTVYKCNGSNYTIKLVNTSTSTCHSTLASTIQVNSRKEMPGFELA